MSFYHAEQRFTALSIVSLFCTLISTCAPTAPVLPYEEKLVIRGLLEAGQLLSDVQISRTIPVLDEFTYEKVFVGDAKATITVDGQAYTMELQPRTSTSASVPYRSLYRVPNLRVVSGKVYAIEVRWKNLEARAQTRVPQPPEADTVSVVASVVPRGISASSNILDTVFQSSAAVRARANEVYRIGTTLHDASSGRLMSSRGFGEAIYTPSAQIVTLTSSIWQLTSATAQILTNRIQSRVNIESYDGDFYQYYLTRNRSGQIGLFSPGGPNIVWNVTGDGIGEFTGMALIQRRTTVHLR